MLDCRSTCWGISALHSAALADFTFTVVQDIGSVLSSERSSAWAPAKPHPYDALIRALARAHRWKRLIEDGIYRSAGEVAEAEKIDRSFVNRLLRLTLMAPDIQEAILDGRQTKPLQLEDLTRARCRAHGTSNSIAFSGDSRREGVICGPGGTPFPSLDAALVRRAGEPA